MIQTETTIWQRCGHLGGPAAAVEEALPPAGPGGGGAQPALAAVIAVVDSGVAPRVRQGSYAGYGVSSGILRDCKTSIVAKVGLKLYCPPT